MDPTTGDNERSPGCRSTLNPSVGLIFFLFFVIVYSGYQIKFCEGSRHQDLYNSKLLSVGGKNKMFSPT